MKPSDEGKEVSRSGEAFTVIGPPTGDGDGKHFTWDYERWWEPIGQYHVYTTEEHGFFPDWNAALIIQAPRTEGNDRAIRELIGRLDEMAEDSRRLDWMIENAGRLMFSEGVGPNDEDVWYLDRGFAEIQVCEAFTPRDAIDTGIAKTLKKGEGAAL